MVVAGVQAGGAKVYDYVIVGSGFGASVCALRLSEKGYKVLVIEKGKWFGKDDFPKTNWNLRRWLWVPFLGFRGIMKITFLRHATILSGTGVGGGSLVYANTLPIPREQFFKSGSWAKLCDWQKELDPYYKLGWKMLGAEQNPELKDGDLLLKKLGAELGREEYFEATRVAVNFGEAEKPVPDPYFGGEGPDVSGCTFCGGCMTGCRHGAKNTLDRNYLWLARKKGAEILAENTVTGILPAGSKDGSEGYIVSYRNSFGIRKRHYSIRAGGIIFAGGVLGTVSLMHSLKKESLPGISDMLGKDIRTNNESLIGVVSLDKSKDFSKGIAIGSILHTDENSHLEPVRYAEGSGFWRITMLPFTLGKNVFVRIFKMMLLWFGSPLRSIKLLFIRNFAARTQILLFMQHLDSTLRLRKGRFGLKSSVQAGDSPTPFMPEAEDLAKRFGRLANGRPQVMAQEPLLGIPSTAHILGGAVMGKDATEGVIDSRNRVFGYKNMLVCDGSVISANPGVNPALSIVAISERAMSFIPDKKQQQ
jgi:cholesterol oxidase